MDISARNIDEKEFSSSTASAGKQVSSKDLNTDLTIKNGTTENELLEDRLRTPSGNLTTTSVQDIRKFYSPDNSARKFLKVKRSDKADSHQSRSTKKESVNREIVKYRAKARKIAAQSVNRRRASKNTDQNNLSAEGVVTSDEDSSIDSESAFVFKHLEGAQKGSLDTITPEHQKQGATIELEDPSDEFLHFLSTQLQGAKSSELLREMASPGENINSDSTSQNAGKSESDDAMDLDMDNPQVVSLQSVAAMFNQLNTNMKALGQKITALENKKDEKVSEKVIEESAKAIKIQVVDEMKEENTKLRVTIGNLQHRNRTLTNVVDRMAIEIQDLKNRVDNIDLNNSKKAISISGLRVDDRKNNMIQEVQRFIECELGLIVTVEDCYKMGGKEPRLLIVHLQTAQEKSDVLHFKYLLKNVENNGRSIFINDYTPMIFQEKKRRERFIQNENSMRDNPLDIKFSKGNMIIQGETHFQKVVPPTPSQLVCIPPEQLSKVLSLKMESSSPSVKDRSIFQGYTTVVSSHKEINELYVKMKLIQPGARHIVCAYWLEGECFYQNKDFHDDDEAGAGKHILEYMLKNGLKNRVIFVSRKYGGVRMGPERFMCYLDVSKEITAKYINSDVAKPPVTYQQVKQREQQRKGAQNSRDAPLQHADKSVEGTSSPSAPPSTSASSSTKRPASSPLHREDQENSGRRYSQNSKSNYRGSFSYSGYRRRNGRFQQRHVSRYPEQSRYDNYQKQKVQSMRDNNDWNYATQEDWNSYDDGSFYQRRKYGYDQD